MESNQDYLVVGSQWIKVAGNPLLVEVTAINGQEVDVRLANFAQFGATFGLYYFLNEYRPLNPKGA